MKENFSNHTLIKYLNIKYNWNSTLRKNISKIKDTIFSFKLSFSIDKIIMKQATYSAKEKYIFH